MFGELFEPTNYSYTVADGVYDITITGWRNEMIKGYSCVVLDIEIPGKPEANPKQWTMWDAPANQDYLKSWRQKMTKFLDAFGVPADHPLNPAEWVGHHGKVFIGKNQKSGFTEVLYPIVDNPVIREEKVSPGF